MEGEGHPGVLRHQHHRDHDHEEEDDERDNSDLFSGSSRNGGGGRGTDVLHLRPGDLKVNTSRNWICPISGFINPEIG